MRKNETHAIIISRENCFKCKDIQDSLYRESVPSEVLYFKQGGAAFLALRKYTPVYLPVTFLLKNDIVVFTADGLADFMEKWEDYLCKED
jgi:hypothetical protein